MVVSYAHLALFVSQVSSLSSLLREQTSLMSDAITPELVCSIAHSKIRAFNIPPFYPGYREADIVDWASLRKYTQPPENFPGTDRTNWLVARLTSLYANSRLTSLTNQA